VRGRWKAWCANACANAVYAGAARPARDDAQQSKGHVEKEFEVLALRWGLQQCTYCGAAASFDQDHRSSRVRGSGEAEVHSRAEAITAAFGLGLFGARRDATARAAAAVP